mgnify:CR=1 FL=1
MKYSRNTAADAKPFRKHQTSNGNMTSDPSYAMPKTFYVSDRGEKEEINSVLVMENNYDEIKQ